MDTNTKNKEVLLNNPQDWSIWNNKFHAHACDRKLWLWIANDPAAGLLKRFPAEPWQIYTHHFRLYEKQEDSLRELRDWISKTICHTYYQTCCNPDESLRVWYAKLQKHAKGSQEEVLRTLQNNYEDAVKPLVKAPRNWHLWLDTWKKAMNEGIQEGLPEAFHHSIWIRDFFKAISPQFPAWVTSVQVSGRTRDLSFDMHTMSNIFTEFIDTLPATPTVVKKGAFGPTYNDKGKSNKKGKRPRAPTTNEQGQKLCRLCDLNGHTIEKCWSVDPKGAASWWPGKRADIIEKNLQDPEIAKEPKKETSLGRRGQGPYPGYGDVDIQVKTPIGSKVLRLLDAAYCENFACNLVSYQLLKKQGIWWDEDQAGNQACAP
ncbi:integrase core domain-containing protein [Hirsutella rhossiliensis]